MEEKVSKKWLKYIEVGDKLTIGLKPISGNPKACLVKEAEEKIHLGN